MPHPGTAAETATAACFLLGRGFQSGPQSGPMIVAGPFKARIGRATKNRRGQRRMSSSVAVAGAAVWKLKPSELRQIMRFDFDLPEGVFLVLRIHEFLQRVGIRKGLHAVFKRLSAVAGVHNPLAKCLVASDNLL